MNNINNLDKNLLVYISPEMNEAFLKEYEDFLKCKNCKMYLIQPKFCYVCNSTLCDSCINCSHNVTFTRSTKQLLEYSKFYCLNYKDGCGELIKYDSLVNHKKTCKSRNISLINANQKNDNYSTTSTANSINCQREESIKFDINVDIRKNKYNCFFCKSEFKNYEQLFEHFKNCNSIQLLFNQENKINDYINLMNKNIYTLLNQNKNRIDFENKNLLDSTKVVCEFENKIINSNKTYEGSKFLSNMISKVKEQYIELLQEKKKNISHLTESIKKNKNSVDSILKGIKFEEERNTPWAKELQIDILSNLVYDLNEDGKKLITSELNSNCYKCTNEIKDTNYAVECKKCRKQFCKSCVKICENISCQSQNSFICPIENQVCGLCRELKYCNDCKVPCFSKTCKYKFCADCFKKNEHQVRSNSNKCEFFTCSKDKRVDCLMSSFYCGKCEQRLCSICLFNDKSHNHFI